MEIGIILGTKVKTKTKKNFNIVYPKYIDYIEKEHLENKRPLRD